MSVLLAGVVACCAAYCFFVLFGTFQFYDDEGKLLLAVQHLLQGLPIYDTVHSEYGPFYFFERWVLFGLLRLPITNDAGRAVTLASWWFCGLVLGVTSWRVAGKSPFALGLAATAGVVSVLHLFVLSNEPNHPQEVITLLLALALWVAATMRDRSQRISLGCLGAIGMALVLTKINVGLFFCVALGASLLALMRSSRLRTLFLFLLALAILAMPAALMRARLASGYAGFCVFMTATLTPCCALLVSRVKASAFGVKEWLYTLLGGLLILLTMVGFASSQGNTLAGMLQALILRPLRQYGGLVYGKPLPLSMLAICWSIVAAAIGLVGALLGPGSNQSRFAAIARRSVLFLRLIACGIAVTTLFSLTWDPAGSFYCLLPLLWLLLIPPISRGVNEANWFFRVLLAFTCCLEPLQIFPMVGSQLYVGTLALPLATVVVLLDFCDEIGDDDRLIVLLRSAVTEPILRIAQVAAILVPAVVLMRFRSYQSLGTNWPLPSLTSLWAVAAAGLGLVVLRLDPERRRLLWPLRLLVCAIVIWGSLTSPLWDTTWYAYVLPLSWLVVVRPKGLETSRTGSALRFTLVFCACLEPLHLLPVVGVFNLHLGQFLMFFIGAVLLGDSLRQSGQDFPFRYFDRHAAFSAATLLFALIVGGIAAADAGVNYSRSVPLFLRGCHWTRVSERDASFYTCATANIRASSDCFVSRFGLASAHFWADQPPASPVIIANLWAGMDRSADGVLLSAHRDRVRMMFIDTPDPWNPDAPKSKFLDFVAEHFRPLARVGPMRLLVRKERRDLDLYDCAFLPKSEAGGLSPSVLYLRLPDSPRLKEVAAIDLVDLERKQELASTSAAEIGHKLILMDKPGHKLLPSAHGAVDLPASGRDLRLSIPSSIRLDRAGYPAVRFRDSSGSRLLTLPVAVEAEVPIP